MRRDEYMSALVVRPSTQQRNNAIPTEIRNSLKFVKKRYLFNIDQIEKRYASNSSGLVINLKNDNIEFDNEECSAENEADLLNNVKKELHKHTLEEYGGTALLSTPAQDPDEKDTENIGNWEKLNKLYDVFLSSSIRQEMNSKSQVVRFKEPLQPIQLPIKRNYCSAFQTNRANFKLHAPIMENSQNINQLSNALFPFFNDKASIVESHAIEEEPVIPLMPVFRTPRRYPEIPGYQSPITRLKRKCLAIEENYDRRTDTLYADESDFVSRWVNRTLEEADLIDYDPDNL